MLCEGLFTRDKHPASGIRVARLEGGRRSLGFFVSQGPLKRPVRSHRFGDSANAPVSLHCLLSPNRGPSVPGKGCGHWALRLPGGLSIWSLQNHGCQSRDTQTVPSPGRQRRRLGVPGARHAPVFPCGAEAIVSTSSRSCCSVRSPSQVHTRGEKSSPFLSALAVQFGPGECVYAYTDVPGRC